MTPARSSDRDRVYAMIMGFYATQAVRTPADLSVAEHLPEGPLRADEIAARESSDVAMTRRLLRAGVALELLEYDAATSTFSGTDLLGYLHPDSAGSLKHYAQAGPGAAWWLPALYLTDTVRSGRNHAVELYLLKFVLHDWSDEQCVTILSNIRAAMPAGARCYIAEMVLTENAPEGAALMDIAMMAAMTGQERDQAQFDTLLDHAGLRRTRVTDLAPPYALIEAVPS